MPKLARSLAIPRNWKTFNVASCFSAIIYPVLGVAMLTTMVILGLALTQIELKLWYLPLSLGVIAFTIFVCNAGIGPLHRLMQHRAGEMR